MSATEFDLEVHEDPVPHIDFNLDAAGRQLAGFGGRLFGYSIRNLAAGSTAEVDLYDGPDTSGVPSISITLADNESTRDWFGGNGVRWRNALYMDVTAGHVQGSVFYRHHRP